MTQRAVLAAEELTDPAMGATRRAALWALGLGALSVVLFVVRLAGLAEATTIRRDAAARRQLIEHAVLERDNTLLTLGGVAFVAAGVMACIWLVRAYTAAGALDPTLKRVSEYWLWVMWILPVVQWVAPVLRLRGLLRAVRPDGSRGWLVFAWILFWMPVDYFQRRVPPPEPPLGAVPHDTITISMWGDVVLHARSAVELTTTWTFGYACAFVLWAALVSTIMGGLERRREQSPPSRAVGVEGTSPG